MANLGTLTLDIVAKIGGYEQGLDKAEREAKKRAAAIERAFDNAFTTITAGFAILGSAGAAALAAVNAQAEAIANYQDLADRVGDTAEAFASLQDASTVSGVAMDTVAAASVKLTASLSKTDDESKAVGQAIKALGLEFDSFKKLSPVEQIDAVAKALAGFEDGAEKTAVAIALFGKTGSELIPFLNDLADGSERNIRLTAEQIRMADEYTKATAKLRAEFDGFIKQQSVELIPTLSQVQQLLGELARNETSVSVATGVMGAAIGAVITVFQTLVVVGSDVGFVLLSVGREIGAIAAQAAALARLDIKGFNAISEAVKEDGKRARAELDAFQKRVMAIGQPNPNQGLGFGTRSTEDRGFNPNPRPRLNIAGLSQDTSKGSADDPTKKLLENQLKELDRAISAERDLMAARNKFLDLYNAEGLLSIKDYYSAQKAIVDEATAAQVQAYGNQIDALRKYQAALPKGKDTQRADAQGKINDLLEKQAKLQQQAGLSAIEMGLRQQKAAKEYGDALQDVQAQILEMNGNQGAAAGIRFDQSNERRRQLFTAEGNEEALKALDTLKKYQIAQAELGKLQQNFALVQGDLQIAEERITIARERGTMGELESLQKSGEARRQQYAILEQQIAAFDRLKVSMQLTPEQMQQYERLKLQLEQLGVSLDPLADKFDTTLKSSFENAFGDFINGTKSAKQAFASFANSIAAEIQKMAIQDLTKQLFKGGTGGAGSWLSGLFGSNNAGGGFDWSKLSSTIGGWFSGFASGGYTGSGGMFQPAGIVHRGEYVLDAATTKRLGVPALDSLRAGGGMGGGVNIAVNVLPGATRETGYQAARDMGRELQRARR